MVKSIERIAFEFWSGIGRVSDLEAWAESDLKSDCPHADSYELFGLSRESAEWYSLRLAKDRSGFTPVSEAGERVAFEVLRDQCRALLSGETDPMQFCSLVQRVEAAFLGREPGSDGTIHSPDWLDALWHCCDWCDESWTIDRAPHLAEQARRLLGLQQHQPG